MSIKINSLQLFYLSSAAFSQDCYF